MILGFIGAGVITDAIVRGVLQAVPDFDEIIVSTRSAKVSEALVALSPKIRASSDNQEIADAADVLVLAVLPQQAAEVLPKLKIAAGQKIISLIATLPIDQIAGWTQSEADICRAIPLPSVADLQGLTVIYPPKDWAEDLFAPLGTVVTVETLKAFDAFAVSSAMMGLYFGLCASTAQWMVNQGVSYENARSYLAEVFSGLSGTATANPDTDFDRLRVDHSTPGGLNAQMFEVFNQRGGEVALEAARESVSKRIRDKHRFGS